MIDTDRAQFGIAVGQLMAVYKEDITPLLLEAWWSVMQPYQLRAVTAAMELHLADIDAGRFAPKPADIRKHLEVTLPKMARAHLGRVVRESEGRAAVLREQILQLQTRVRLGMAKPEDIATELHTAGVALAAELQDAARAAAQQGIELRDARARDETTRLPASVLALIGQVAK